MFIDSNGALRDNANQSPDGKAMKSSPSFVLLNEDAAQNYLTLKKGSDMNRTLAKRRSASHMDSALSI